MFALNWGELKAAASEYLEAGSDKYTKNLPLFARLAEEDIYREVQLPVTRQTVWTTTIPQDHFLSLPPDWLSPYSVRLLVNGEYRHLDHKEPSYLREAYPDPEAYGIPRYYALFDEATFLLAPPPISNFPIEMDYFQKIISISKDDDNANKTWLSENAENAMLFGIIYHGYVFEKGDQDVITSYKEQFAKAVGNLKTIAEGRQKKDTNRMPDQRMPT